jgi:histidine triad (HIT) family protein
VRDCVFCGIAVGNERAWVVDEDEWTVSFLALGQATEGHTLVIPRRHAVDIWDITVDEMADLARATHRVAGILRERLSPHGISLFQSNGAAAWQTVFHLHVHVVPRYPGDPLVLPWQPTVSSPEALDATLTRIQDTGRGGGA